MGDRVGMCVTSLDAKAIERGVSFSPISAYLFMVIFEAYIYIYIYIQHLFVVQLQLNKVCFTTLSLTTHYSRPIAHVTTSS